jgi:hypothetical protein
MSVRTQFVSFRQNSTGEKIGPFYVAIDHTGSVPPDERNPYAIPFAWRVEIDNEIRFSDGAPVSTGDTIHWDQLSAGYATIDEIIPHFAPPSYREGRFVRLT